MDSEVLGSNPRSGGVEVKCALTCCKDLEQVLHSLVAWRVVLVALETCGPAYNAPTGAQAVSVDR